MLDKKIKTLRTKIETTFGFSNRYIAEEILGVDQRTLSGICTGNRMPKNTAALKRYIIVLESYLQHNKK
jgi:hypothetical protein